MDNTIRQELEYIEAAHDITILYACEAGSRIWGFESEDSDYDIRFIYVRGLEHYLSLNVETKRDVIDVIEDNAYPVFDIVGWDLRKTLKLFKKCNPPLVEWLNSPTIYRKDDKFYSDLKELIPIYYNYAAMCYHYYHMAKGNYRTYLQGDEVWLKKYLYVLRPLLSVSYLMQHNEPPPMGFGYLATETIDNEEVWDAVVDLLVLKVKGAELSTGPRIPEISDYIDEQIDTLGKVRFAPSDYEKSWEPLNELFRQYVK